jgi:hypothetical protein
VDAVRRIADAVLYEGYVLWPYRKSAMKNQRRWTFGGVYPEAHTAQHPDDPSVMQAECLVEGGPDASVTVAVRFLHVVARQVMAHGPDGLEPVGELEAGGERHVSWDEATERELSAGELRLGDLAEAGRHVKLDVGAGARGEAVEGGAVERSWHALRGTVDVDAARLRDGLYRVSVRVRNATPWEGTGREEALRRTFCSTHAVLRARGGAFVSLTDPPEDLRDAAEGCENAGVWPVLVGEKGDRGTLLCSPMILPDHPEIAPESPGDLFDGGEIDQLLILNILSLTDEEKREMRASDPRAREILNRTEALSEEELMKLHGTIREFGLARR